jgi:large conductance mechanosensitive channel
VAYGLFANQVLVFLIVAFTLFLVIKGVNRMRRNQPVAA